MDVFKVPLFVYYEGDYPLKTCAGPCEQRIRDQGVKVVSRWQEMLPPYDLVGPVDDHLEERAKPLLDDAHTLLSVLFFALTIHGVPSKQVRFLGSLLSH